MASSVFGELKSVAKELGDAFGQVFKEESESVPEPVTTPAPEIHIDMGSARSGGLVALTCPQCNANVQVSADRSTCYCTYCGAQMLVDDGAATVTYRTIDETKIREIEERRREAEAEAQLKLKRLELAEAHRPFRLKLMAVLAVVAAITFIIAALSEGSAQWAYVVIGMLCLLAIELVFTEMSKERDDIDESD